MRRAGLPFDPSRNGTLPKTPQKISKLLVLKKSISNNNQTGNVRINLLSWLFRLTIFDMEKQQVL
jgi:hypothetical protein